MLILLLVITIIGVIVCGIGTCKSEYNDDNWLYATTLFAIPALCILLVFFFVLGLYIDNSYADERIEIVKTKNAEIEKEIQVAVKSYLEHEGKTYAEMTPDEALAVAVAYPELASNELVKEQIATYKSNREEVLQYEQRKIDKKVKAWWLWFGSE